MNPSAAIWEVARVPVTLVQAARGLARLPGLEESLRELTAGGGPLDRLTDVSVTLTRLAALDQSLIQLGKLDRSLERIADVGESLERIAPLGESVGRLAVTTEGLAGINDTIRDLQMSVNQLGASLQPIGRIAGRIPGSGTRPRRRRRTAGSST